MSSPGSPRLKPRSALRHASYEHDPSGLGSSSTDAPTAAERESLTLQQLKEMKAEAEERMSSLNTQIDRAMQGMFPKKASISPRTEFENVEDRDESVVSEDTMQRKLSIGSRVSTVSQSKVVSFTPSLEEELGDDGDAVTQPLLRRDRSGNHAHAHFEAICSGEVFDPNSAGHVATVNAERTRSELMRRLSVRTSSGISEADSNISGEVMSKRCTIHRQAAIVSKLSLSLRIFGVALAFLTMVLNWEFADYAMLLMFPNAEQLLIGYLGLAVVAAGCLALSQDWMNKAAEDRGQSSLPASFAYALSTLYMAIGLWGIINSAMSVLVPKKKHIFVYSIVLQHGCASTQLDWPEMAVYCQL